MRRINQIGLELIKHFEGFKAQAYQDQGGIWTIGYGHTGVMAQPGATCDEEFAEKLLEKDLETRCYPLVNYVQVALTDNEYAALCSLVYNVGLGAFHGSQTLHCINSGTPPDAEWQGFCHVNGKVAQGLVRRRQAEIELFNS